MAKLLTRKQPIIAGVTHPMSQYSRVVSMMCGVGSGVGNNDYAFTPTMSDNIWLLSIKAWFMSDTAGSQGSATFFIRCASSQPGSYAEVQAARNLVPVYARMSFVEWNFHGESFSFDWTMSELIARPDRRFAIAISNLSPTVGISMRASFEISES